MHFVSWVLPMQHFKVKILDCKLYLRTVKISPSVFIAHNKTFEGGIAKYPIRRAVCKTYTIPTGNLDHALDNLFTGQIPTRIVIGCVDNDAYFLSMSIRMSKVHNTVANHRPDYGTNLAMFPKWNMYTST